MDQDQIQDDIDQATAIGMENLQVIGLAAAWCEHIGLDKGPLGTGLIEQATGLPISGGSLRCDFANHPRTYGMVLKDTAVEFYAANCIGCPHHKPTGRTPNLGTWADEVIAQRNEAARQAEEHRRVDAERRRERARNRRFLVGAPDPAVQGLLDLVDRIDAETPDADAEALLLKTAELSPQDLPDPLLEHLAGEAIAIRRGALLEVVFKVFELSGRPGLHSVMPLAFSAVATGIASKVGGGVIAAHATTIPPDQSVRLGIIQLAAGSFSFHGSEWTGGKPAALLRFFDVDPTGAVDALGLALRHEGAAARTVGAHAARHLVRSRAASGPLLLPALLDCVQMPDDSRYHGDPFAASTAADVVADVLIADPRTDDAIAARMTGAGEREGRALWKCYSHAAPTRFRAGVPDETIALIERRAVSILHEDRPAGLLAEVSETLSHLTDDHEPTVGVPLAELIALLRFWNGKIRDAEGRRPPDGSPMLAFLEWDNEKIRIRGIARNLDKAVEGKAREDFGGYVEAIEPLLERTGRAGLDDRDKESLLDALGVMRTEDDIAKAEPLLTRVLTTGETLERSAALGALAKTSRREITIPGPLQRLIVSNLVHTDRLWVRIAAIRAVHLVEVEPSERLELVNVLVGFAFAYKREALRSDDVERALSRALRLAEDQDFELQVKDLALKIVNDMPSTEAADALEHLHGLRTGPEWVAAVVRALEPDDRGGDWFGVHEMKKEDLLRLLAEAPAAWLETNWDALEAAALRDPDFRSTWTWAVADLFGRHGQHERAASLAQAVVDGTPDTRESRHRRRLARLITYGHRINAAADDPAEMKRLLDEAAALAAEDASDNA